MTDGNGKGQHCARCYAWLTPPMVYRDGLWFPQSCWRAGAEQLRNATRLGHETHTRQAAATRMRAHNPGVIPRNHRVEAVLDAAVHQGDFAPLEAFLAVLATPFALAPHQAYSAPPAPSARVYQTFCGT